MFAYDSNVTDAKSEAVVLITVLRNPDAPFVDRLTYNIELDEFYNVKFAVLDLNATDPNGVSTDENIVKNPGIATIPREGYLIR